MEPEENAEDRLAAELEDMYKRVASVEKPVRAEDRGDEIPLHQPYEQAQFPSLTDSGEEAAGEQVGERTSDTAPPFSQRGGRRRIRKGALVVLVVGAGLLLYSILFWPTLYEVAMIHQDGHLYPVRISRITGAVLYFDGQQWRDTPIPQRKAPLPLILMPVPARPAPEPPATVTPAKPPAPSAPAPAAPVAAVAQKEAVPDRRPVPAAPPSPTPEMGSSAQKAKKTPARATQKQGPFAVQIRAFVNPEEARKLVEALKSRGMAAESVAVPVGDRGVWNRVLVGRFKDRDAALAFMRKHNIKEDYPDSFVQKRSP